MVFPSGLRSGTDDYQTCLRALRNSLFQQLASQTSSRLQIENRNLAKLYTQRALGGVWRGCDRNCRRARGAENALQTSEELMFQFRSLRVSTRLAAVRGPRRPQIRDPSILT